MSQDLYKCCVDAMAEKWSSSPTFYWYFYETKILAFLIINYKDCRFRFNYHRIKASSGISTTTTGKDKESETTITYKEFVQKTDDHYIKINSVSRFNSDGNNLVEQMKSFIALCNEMEANQALISASTETLDMIAESNVAAPRVF